MAQAACASWRIDYRRAMRRLDVTAIAFGVAAGAFGLSAGTGPLAPGLAALVLGGLVLRARSALYIAVWAVAPLLVWATYPDLSALIASLALAASALCALLAARQRPESPEEATVAARVTLAAAMVMAASGLLSFDILLR
jgi:hypothetical protein